MLVDRVRAVRAAVGPDIRLRLDVNGAWDLETATDRLDAIARFALEYVEQPLAGDDAAELAELRRRVRVPIAADETVTSLRAARALLDAGAVDVLVVKPVRVGGPVVAAEIAALAAERGVPVVISTLFETGVGIAAGLAVAAALPSSAGRGSRARARSRARHGRRPGARPAGRGLPGRGGTDAGAGRTGRRGPRDRARRAGAGPVRGRVGRVGLMGVGMMGVGPTAGWSAEQRVRAHAALAGGAAAILDGPGTTTWAELDRLCDAVVAAVRAAGVVSGGVVAVVAEPSARRPWPRSWACSGRARWSRPRRRA